MRILEIVEATDKTAVFAFGRMNPITIGHQKIADTIKQQNGDPFLFLTHTQNAKKDPLTFGQKKMYATNFFPGVTVGDDNVRTIIDAMKKLEAMNYNRVIYVAGSDRVDSFNELLNKYNGADYNFDSIDIVSAGERDPEVDGARGMSASKMRDFAARGDLQTFINNVPGEKKLATKMYMDVRKAMGYEAVQKKPQPMGQPA